MALELISKRWGGSEEGTKPLKEKSRGVRVAQTVKHVTWVQVIICNLEMGLHVCLPPWQGSLLLPRPSPSACAFTHSLSNK